MSRVVFKYQMPSLGVMRDFTFDADAPIVHFAIQGDVPCFWAEVGANKPTAVRTFIVVGTGQSFKFEGRHCGTCLMSDGEFVWHLYEVTR